MSNVTMFKDAVRNLHTEKDAAYGPSWKRRGEQISIMANIARKVDRLEMLASGTSPTRDENALDTAVDLLVYTLKYQTYLADCDAEVASRLLPYGSPPYSDGCAAFEMLLDALDLSALDENADSMDLTMTSVQAVDAFNELELCFATPGAPLPVTERLKYAAALAVAAANVVVALSHETYPLYYAFLETWRDGSARS